MLETVKFLTQSLRRADRFVSQLPQTTHLSYWIFKKRRRFAPSS